MEPHYFLWAEIACFRMHDHIPLTFTQFYNLIIIIFFLQSTIHPDYDFRSPTYSGTVKDLWMGLPYNILFTGYMLNGAHQKEVLLQ